MSLALKVHSVMVMLSFALLLGAKRRAEEKRNLWGMSTVFQPETHFNLICSALWTLQFIHEHRVEAPASAWGHSVQALHLNSRCDFFLWVSFAVTLQTVEPLLQDIWWSGKVPILFRHIYFSTCLGELKSVLGKKFSFKIQLGWIKLHELLSVSTERDQQ